MIRPRVLTPEGYRLKGMWRWQEARSRNSHSSGTRFIRARRGPPWPTVWESGHDLARKASQLLLATEQRQDDVFDPGAL